MPQSTLSKCVVAPSRLAKLLKWNTNLGTIMGLEITRSRIAVAIAPHPSKNSGHIHKLDPIPYLKQDCGDDFRNMKKEYIIRELSRIVESEKVCGFVVGWPLEPSSFPGSRCGQVLHLLDFLTEKRLGGRYLISNSRPVVLWDERIITHNQFDEQEYPQDEWGRSERFSHKYEPQQDGNTFMSSLRTDFPTTDDSTAASLLLEEFFKQHSNLFGTIEESDGLTGERSCGNDFQRQEAMEEHEIDMVDVCASSVL
mmetsp:Transcript_15796/g.23737  ORF Transcript_15796/g.23737 Transcript_15796/m.23737 type:complete len:254 (-) Transcript_15796:36-797(-)